MLFSSAHSEIENISRRLLEHPNAVPSIVPDHSQALDTVERQRLQDIIGKLRSELGAPLDANKSFTVL